jgi:WD40 repeat protein
MRSTIPSNRSSDASKLPETSASTRLPAKIERESLNLKAGALQSLSVDVSQRAVVVAYSSSLKLIGINRDEGEQRSRLLDADSIDVKAASNSQGGFTLSDVAWNQLSINKIAASATSGDIFIVDIERNKAKADSIKLLNQWFTGSSSSNHPEASAASPSLANRNPLKLRFNRKSPFFTYNSEDLGAVNKISWSPFHSEIIAGACQNGSVKIYDCRTKSSTNDIDRCVSVFNPQANAARDVQFNPLHDHSIAAIFDNGCWCLWDIRSPSKALHKVPGHTSSGYTLAWHPSQEGLLATGSRDKSIKVWKLISYNGMSESFGGDYDEHRLHESMNDIVRPVYAIQTSSAVNYLSWKPGRRHGDHQLASASAERGDISIWSAPLLMVPECILRGRIDACTGFAWINSSDRAIVGGEGDDYDSMLSIGKDGKLVWQHLSSGFYPRQHISSHVTAISSLGHVAIQRGKISENYSIATATASAVARTANSAIAAENGVVSLGLADLSLPNLRAASLIRSSRPERAEGNVFDPAMLLLLAQSYYTGWEGIGAIAACTHNQSVAQAAGLRCRAAVWASALAIIPHKQKLSSDALIPFAIDLLGDLLLDLLEAGDCLHFVFLSEALRQSGLLAEITRDKISELRQRETYVSLIDMLMRQRLFSVATSLIKVSEDPHIKAMGSAAVTIHTNCSRCSKEVPDSAGKPWCERCKSCLTLCAVCQRPCQRLYLMCPVCAHGGHKECLDAWFGRFSACPTGCEHYCREPVNILGNSSIHNHLQAVQVCSPSAGRAKR